MTSLVRPDCRFRDSWAAAVAEFRDDPMHGSGLWDFAPVDTTEDGCREVVAHLLTWADPAAELPEDRVHCDYLWIVDRDEFVGYLAVRHASRALALALPRAAALGLERVLLTCDEDNEGSRRTIEGNGGRYEDTRNGKRRYWIDARSSPTRH